MTTGELVRQARDVAGLTQAEVAIMLGVSRPQVSNIEAGRSDVPANRLLSFLEQCGAPLAAGEVLARRRTEVDRELRALRVELRRRIRRLERIAEELA